MSMPPSSSSSSSSSGRNQDPIFVFRSEANDFTGVKKDIRKFYIHNHLWLYHSRLEPGRHLPQEIPLRQFTFRLIRLGEQDFPKFQPSSDVFYLLYPFAFVFWKDDRDIEERATIDFLKTIQRHFNHHFPINHKSTFIMRVKNQDMKAYWFLTLFSQIINRMANPYLLGQSRFKKIVFYDEGQDAEEPSHYSKGLVPTFSPFFDEYETPLTFGQSSYSLIDGYIFHHFPSPEGIEGCIRNTTLRAQIRSLMISIWYILIKGGDYDTELAFDSWKDEIREAGSSIEYLNNRMEPNRDALNALSVPNLLLPDITQTPLLFLKTEIEKAHYYLKVKYAKQQQQ